MKQNNKLFGFAAMAALLFTGCAKDATEDVPAPGEKLFTLEIVPDEKIEALTEDGTRTYWDEATETVKWSNSDRMLCLMANLQYDKYASNNNGTFTCDYGSDWFPKDVFVAGAELLLTGIAPEYDSGSKNTKNVVNKYQTPDRLWLSLPLSQESTIATFDLKRDVMIGSQRITITQEDVDNGKKKVEGMSFARVMAISKYTFALQNDNLSADETVESVTLTAVSAGDAPIYLTGSYCLDISDIPARCVDRNGEQINLRTPFANGSPSVSTTYAADAQPKLGELVFWPITAPVKLEAGDMLRFRIVTNKHEITKEIVLSKELYYANNKLNRATVKLDADAQIYTFGGETIDLSANGTANSYIVNKPRSTYKFRADVKGNGIVRSNMGVLPDNEADLKIEPKAAVVLWYNTVQTDRENWLRDCPIVLESVKLADNYIEFSTPETFLNGNVLIAVIDQPLAADEITVDPTTRQFTNTNILWSWNLICSEGYDLNDAAQQYTKNGYTFMTRDLGAVLDASENLNRYSQAATQGNIYQWGRKDPFPTIPDYDSANVPSGTGLQFTPTFTTVPGLEIEGELGTYGKVDKQVFGNTSAMLVTNLTTETVGNGTGYTNEEAMDFATKLPYRWFNASVSGATDDQRWYWIRHYQPGKAIWGNPDSETEFKSIYDPCPVGWRVASEKAWMALTDNLTVTVTAKDKYFYFSTGPVFPVWEGRNQACEPGSYSIAGWSGNICRARYMTSTVEEFYGLMPHLFQISALKGNYDQNPEAQCDKILNRIWTSYGSRIRCVKDNE